MNYPGNSSLSSDVHERVLNTYRQTLDLAARGNRQEASLGCDFILRLDPEFEPARTLMNRLERGDGPVAIDDLRPGGPAFHALTPPDDDVFDELEHVDLDLGGDEGRGAEGGPGGGSTVGEMRRLLEKRRFGEVLQRVREDETLRDDPEVSGIVRAARSRQEAEPYIQSFLESARQELRSGSHDQAARLLESARELDPGHPGLADLQRLLATGGAAATPAEATRAAPATPRTPPASSPGAPGSGGPAHGTAPATDSGDGPEGTEIDLGPDHGGGLDDSLDSVDLSLGDDSEVSLGSEPAAGGDDRIHELLHEGQAAFDQEDYQGAIDAWSRIFLIDIDHQEAARRIEKARRLKAEHERRVEELFHEGMGALEDGDADQARELLQKVVSLQPNHLAAKDALQKIEAGEVPRAKTEPEAPAPPAEEPSIRPRTTPIPPALADSEASMSEEVLIPPEPGGPLPVSAPELDTFDRSGPNRTFLFIGALVLVGVLAGAWLVYQEWSDWFPNANGQAESPPAEDPLRKATSYHDLGRTDLAIAQLSRLPPNDPHYEEAQALISQWEAEAGQTAEERADETGDTATGEGDESEAPEAQDRIRQGDLVAEARRAAARGEFLPAENLLIKARQLGELDSEGRSLEAEVRERLEPFRREIELVRGGDWEFALPDLWRLRESDPENPDINRLLVTSYYNLGVRDLQRGDATGAVSQFEEASNLLDDRDPALERHLRFARAYQGRSKDLLYQIYVKYLPVRR